MQRRRLTAFGVKPIGTVQWDFCYRWLYGVVEPKTGESLFLEFSHLDSECFQTFLDSLAQTYPDDLHLVHLDNAPAHTAKSIQIPNNIILLFQPPYCPELNPIERLWQEFNRDVAWKQFASLEDLQQQISDWVHQLTPAFVQSLTHWDWLINALYVAGI